MNYNNLQINISEENVNTLEDKILLFLFKNANASESSISKKFIRNLDLLSGDKSIDDLLTDMKVEGYLYYVTTLYYEKIYGLTALGVFEAHKRFNYNYLYSLYNELDSKGYNPFDIMAFLRNYLYMYHISKLCKDTDLESQFLEWCTSKDIKPKALVKKINPIVIGDVMYLNK